MENKLSPCLCTLTWPLRRQQQTFAGAGQVILLKGNAVPCTEKSSRPVGEGAGAPPPSVLMGPNWVREDCLSSQLLSDFVESKLGMGT